MAFHTHEHTTCVHEAGSFPLSSRACEALAHPRGGTTCQGFIPNTRSLPQASSCSASCSDGALRERTLRPRPPARDSRAFRAVGAPHVSPPCRELFDRTPLLAWYRRPQDYGRT